MIEHVAKPKGEKNPHMSPKGIILILKPVAEMPNPKRKKKTWTNKFKDYISSFNWKQTKEKFLTLIGIKQNLQNCSKKKERLFERKNVL